MTNLILFYHRNREQRSSKVARNLFGSHAKRAHSGSIYIAERQPRLLAASVQQTAEGNRQAARLIPACSAPVINPVCPPSSTVITLTSFALLYQIILGRRGHYAHSTSLPLSSSISPYLSLRLFLCLFLPVFLSVLSTASRLQIVSSLLILLCIYVLLSSFPSSLQFSFYSQPLSYFRRCVPALSLSLSLPPT